MVQPINYTIPVADPFESLTRGMNLGLQMEKVQAVRQQRAMQAQQMQADMEVARQKAEQDAAKAAELARLQEVPLEDMTQAQRFRLMELTQSEATRAHMARAYESLNTEQRANQARNSGSLIVALGSNPQVGIRRLQTMIEAEKDPAQKQALQVALQIAEINPLEAAKMIDGTLSMAGPEFSKVAESARNYLKNTGKPLYPEQEKPIVVGRESSVFMPGTREFLTPPAPPTPPVSVGRGGGAPTAEKPAKPGKAVKVVDPDTGKIVMVSEQEAIERRMTPAEGLEGLSPKEIQRREATFPQARQSVRSVTSTMSTIEETIDRLLKNKSGLNQATGFILGREMVPAVTDEARLAVADINQLKNLAFVQGLTELRQASTTGAGVGNVSNKEGDRFENLKASLDRVQSYDDLVAALRRLKAQATNTKSSMQTAFDDTYDYRQQQARPPAPSGAPQPPAAGGRFPTPPQAAIDALRQGRGTDAQFDAIFGPGAAARARGR